MSEVATYLQGRHHALLLDMIETAFSRRTTACSLPCRPSVISVTIPPPGDGQTQGRRTITPLQLQTEYLEHATRYVQTIDADPVTRMSSARWTRVIETLHGDPMDLHREVDWVIKKRIIESFMRSTGFPGGIPRCR